MDCITIWEEKRREEKRVTVCTVFFLLSKSDVQLLPPPSPPHRHNNWTIDQELERNTTTTPRGQSRAIDRKWPEKEKKKERKNWSSSCLCKASFRPSTRRTHFWFALCGCCCCVVVPPLDNGFLLFVFGLAFQRNNNGGNLNSIRWLTVKHQYVIAFQKRLLIPSVLFCCVSFFF